MGVVNNIRIHGAIIGLNANADVPTLRNVYKKKKKLLKKNILIELNSSSYFVRKNNVFITLLIWESVNHNK